jgi:hypothetical protein
MHYVHLAAVAAIGFLPAVALGQSRAPAPLPAAIAVMERLAAEAAALSYESRQFLFDKDDLEEVEEELRDVARDMEKVLRTLNDARYRPSKWDRLHKQVEDLEEEIDELAEEVDEALRRQNLQRNRRRFHLNHHARLHGPASRVLVVDNNGVERVVVGRAPAHTPGWELKSRVATMQLLVRELCDLSHMR